jgi:hypothetical protein
MMIMNKNWIPELHLCISRQPFNINIWHGHPPPPPLGSLHNIAFDFTCTVDTAYFCNPHTAKIINDAQNFSF